MNHIFRSIWNQALGCWMAVSENSKSKRKCSGTCKKLLATGLLLCASNSWALPTGEQIVAGQATVNTPTANQMQINQTSQKAVINWQGFSVGQQETVNINQPNSQAALLNRVVGQDASQIQGKLNANGQVYIVNPNGVVFGKTAQVDVGGLVASTHNISNADFLNGKNHFTQNGATGTVENHGIINTSNGGVVALIGEKVSNTGTINTPKGTTALAAGKTVDLDFQGDGLVEVKVSEAALNAQITNQGAIQADGGRIAMTAKAANQLIDTVINQNGIIKAQGLVQKNGEIILDGGDNGTVKVSGELNTTNNSANATGGNITVAGANILIDRTAKLDASATQQGGHIQIGDKQHTQQLNFLEGAIIDSNVTENGSAGQIDVFANMDKGQVNVKGNINAQATKQGNGGFIETSAAHVSIANTAKISTKAKNGVSGTWLIDPVDFTIAATGGDMTGAFLSNSLLNSSVVIDSVNGTSGVNGDVNINDIVSWSANRLYLFADRNININADLNGSGTAQLQLHYGYSGAGDYFINNGAKVSLPAGQNFFTYSVPTGVIKTYTVITSLGAQGSTTTTDLQGMDGNLTLNYALGADIDATATSGWNAGAGFKPIGNGATASYFSGIFDGLGHTVTGLTINNPTTLSAGLFDTTLNSFIRNIGLINSSVQTNNPNPTGGLVGYADATTISNAYVTGLVSGINYVGGLVGYMQNGTTINNAYATASVTGTSQVGGLVGSSFGSTTINNAYATGSVSGTNRVGGLVGVINGVGDSINNVYATGSVSGTSFVGGLVGVNIGSINNAYATGNVTGTTSVGGLVGAGTASVTNAFWDTQTSGQTISAGGTGKTIAEMQQMTTFTGWSIANTYDPSTVWRIYEGNTAPLLRSFLTPLTVTNNNTTYNGLLQSTYINTLTGVSIIPNNNLLGATIGYGTATNAGIYSFSTTGLFSNQQGYDISQSTGALTINPAALTITANDAFKTYGQALNFFGTEFSSSGLQNGETIDMVSLFSDGSAASARVAGNPYAITVSNATGGTFDPNNYAITYVDGTLTVDRAPLLIWVNDVYKYFDRLAFTGGDVSYGFFGFFGFVNGEDSRVLSGNLEFSGDSQGAVDPGLYTISASGLSADNYNILYSDGFLSIIDTHCITCTLDPDPDPDPDQSKASDSTGSGLSSVLIDTGSSTLSPKHEEGEPYIIPSLSVKNSAGRVKRLKMSANKKFLSLLLEDGSVRVWDFENGVQRNIVGANKKQELTDVSSVDNNGEIVSVANKTGIGAYDIIGSLLDDKLSVQEPEVNYFANSNDGSLLLLSTNNKQLSLWDSQKNKQLWESAYQRGTVTHLTLSDDNRYAAVLSRQDGVYEYDLAGAKLKTLTDALDIIDLATGKTVKSLPNFGENVVHTRFKDNNTLQLGLASGQLVDWAISADKHNAVASFPEAIMAIDHNKDTYAYIAENNAVRISDGQGAVKLSIQNPDNPIMDARLLADGKKLLTVLDNGDLALWDVASGKKMLRLFSTQQGWTVMDAAGRFDGSDEAIENFNWIADEEAIPLSSFSENYYEPGLLTNVLQDKDYLNSNPDVIRDGISLPPKVTIQLAEQQDKGDKVSLKLDVYDRGGGIDKIQLYQNGKLISNEGMIATEQTPKENNADHQTLLLNLTPVAGENTLKVVASNKSGIENTSAEIRFDGKTKAYQSSVRLMTVGINNYKESRLHLNYSVADAQLIADTLKNNAKLIASKSLTDENATKPQILAELKELSQGTEQDALVIYFAGHGVAVGKEWYFLPYETKLLPKVEDIVKAGISASELSDIFKKSKIQHIMLMVDSCHSGGGINAFSTLENGQRYFSRQLSRSLGITVVTAAAKNQEATELKSLGHGLFTYQMAEEMTNKDKTKSVTAHGVANSILKSLPALTKKISGKPQEPVVFTKGNDFMLTDLLKNKK